MVLEANRAEIQIEQPGEQGLHVVLFEPGAHLAMIDLEAARDKMAGLARSS